MASRENLKRPAPEKKGEVKRKRRRRTAFSEEQLDRLEGSFEQERFTGIQIREELAWELNIGEDGIQTHKGASEIVTQTTQRISKLFTFRSGSRIAVQDSSVGPNSEISIPTIFQPSLACFPPFTSSPLFFHFNDNTVPVASQGSQTVSFMLGLRVSASVSPSFCSNASPSISHEKPFQTSCVKNSYSADDYLAAVTLASGFQREN